MRAEKWYGVVLVDRYYTKFYSELSVSSNSSNSTRGGPPNPMLIDTYEECSKGLSVVLVSMKGRLL